MHFDISHVIPDIDVAAFERLYFDEPFNVALCEAVGLQRRLIRLEAQGSGFLREVEVVPLREIPAPVRKVLGDKRIAYTEIIRYDTQRHRGTWSTVSSVLSDKISSGGDIEMNPVAKGVQRRVTGDVAVRVFGLGGLIERFIVADVAQGYEQAAHFTQKYLASVGA